MTTGDTDAERESLIETTVPSIHSGIDFDGDHALVTGGSSGIGHRIAQEFVDAGASVSILDRDPAGRQDGTPVHASTDAATFVQADLTDEDAVADAIEEAINTFGPLDVVVNNAGVNHLGSAESVSIQEWDEVLSVNLRGSFLVSRFALPSIRETGGSIVNVASIAGLRGSPSYAAYGPSKAALINLTKQMAADYAAESVRVNSVAPGIIDAGMAKQELEDPDLEAYKREQTKLDRLGQSQDVANGVLFLASDAASFITGETLVIDGGWLV